MSDISDVIDVTNAKILMVDDTPANIDVLRKILMPEGYKLSFANSGEKALHIAARSLPDLILLDVMMPPGIDGFETCRRLKQDPVTEKVPVIFITAKTDVESLIESFRIGAVDYIGKPFRQEEVCMRVRTHLQTQVLIMQRQRLRNTLQVSEERFRLLASWAPLAIFQTDAQGNIIYVNQYWQQQFGLSTDQIQGSAATWLQLIHPEDREQIQTQWQNMIATAQAFTAKFRLQAVSGEIYWLQAQFAALLNEESQIEGLIGALRVMEQKI